MAETADFDAFYNATNRRVLHQIYAMTGNLADAQECTQEAYARAWQRWKTVSQATNPEAWIRTVAWRIAASRWRKASAFTRRRNVVGSGFGSDQVALVGALRRLPEAQRQAIVLHHLVGMSVDDIAHETGTPTGTIKARLSRARTALAHLLTDDETNMTMTGGGTP